MQGINLFKIFLDRFNQIGAPYMVTGSVASIIYGEPRLTHDMDLVLSLNASDVDEFIKHFPPDQFYCPPAEIIRAEVSREKRGHFNLIHQESGFKADIYPVCKDELHKWAMNNRQKILVQDTPVWVAPPEYVIIRKLQYFQEGRSEKHLEDIKNILKFSDEQIDKSFLKKKISEYNLTSLWEKLNGE